MVATLDDGTRSRGRAVSARAAVCLEVDVDLVELYAGGDRPLRQPGGRPQAGGFRGLRAGKKQEIVKFERCEPAAHRLACCIDTSGSMAASLAATQTRGDRLPAERR